MLPSKKVNFEPWPLATDHHGLLIIPIHWLVSSLCLLSTSKLVCGGRSGIIWLLSHLPGGCCTLVVDEEITPDNVERFQCLENCYINVINYYYYRDHSFIQNHSRPFRFPAPCWCFVSSIHPTHFLQGSVQRTGMAIAEAWFCAQWPVFVFFLRFVFGLLYGWKI